MEALILEPTEFTPKIIFDYENNNFEVSGFSRPEDVRSFYKPIINWLEQFDEEVLKVDLERKYTSEPLKFVFKMDYFNSASAKFMLDILVELNKFFVRGIPVQVDWYYEDGDDEILESGEELNEMVDFKFNFIVRE